MAKTLFEKKRATSDGLRFAENNARNSRCPRTAHEAGETAKRLEGELQNLIGLIDQLEESISALKRVLESLEYLLKGRDGCGRDVALARTHLEDALFRMEKELGVKI